jgi:DNA polymerase
MQAIRGMSPGEDGKDAGVTTKELRALQRRAEVCKECDLWVAATQTVFGEGPVPARVMLMGEVPGDREDLAGRPFVGPAGKILDEALADVGLARDDVYLTNAVKHFKFEQRGKVRIHKKPNRTEIAACSRWWKQELALVQPTVLGLLGATAAQAVLGPEFRVTKQRGQWFEADADPPVPVLATIHPAAILRAQERRAQEYADFVSDLAVLARKSE